MNQKLWEQFRDQYRECIDEKGNPKLAGRYATIRLIETCERLDLHNVYGDRHGRMYIHKIQKLARDLGII